MIPKKSRGRLLRTVSIVLCCALLAAKCQSGTLLSEEQSCRSSHSLLHRKQVVCTGSVDTVRGSPSLTLVKSQELQGRYGLRLEVKVKQGSMRAGVGAAGGKVTPGSPLKLRASLEPYSNGVTIRLKTLKKEVKGLSYRARLTPQR